MFEKNKITKSISIEGMSCVHCVKKVEKALKEKKEIKSVSVSLEKKKAEVDFKEEVGNEVLKSWIEDLGYQVVKIN